MIGQLRFRDFSSRFVNQFRQYASPTRPRAPPGTSFLVFHIPFVVIVPLPSPNVSIKVFSGFEDQGRSPPSSPPPSTPRIRARIRPRIPPLLRRSPSRRRRLRSRNLRPRRSRRRRLFISFRYLPKFLRRSSSPPRSSFNPLWHKLPSRCYNE